MRPSEKILATPLMVSGAKRVLSLSFGSARFIPTPFFSLRSILQISKKDMRRKVLTSECFQCLTTASRRRADFADAVRARARESCNQSKFFFF